MRPFTDRGDAARQLATRLRDYAGRPNTIVLGLPRGGVVVAAEVAKHLRLPLDVLVVRKLGVPWNRELAVGALASGGVQLLDHALLGQLGLTVDDLTAVIEEETEELARRERVFRGARASLALAGRTVVLADDGLATGATMLAAIDAVRQLGAAAIVVAAPVASAEACSLVVARGVSCCCVATPRPFHGVGHWYDDFHDVSDDEVLTLLRDTPSADGARVPRESPD